MFRTILLSLLFLGGAQPIWAFCGFYVAKADLKLLNKASQVILVRDGEQTTVTMYNDFQGKIEDFAMVVPVPEVLSRKQIKVIEGGIFQKINDYSSPRVVQYYDRNPCPAKYPALESQHMNLDEVVVVQSLRGRILGIGKKKYQVKVKKRYDIKGYSIVILSAKNSKGLKLWLTDHGYKIPGQAAELLEPYIKSGMNFFVVKVNKMAINQMQGKYLKPIQISYTSSRFMLPIRLGMANAEAPQDMLVYAFSKKGRIEASNYQTRNVPTNFDIPIPVLPKFGAFYNDLFAKTWSESSQGAVHLEYAWNLSGSNQVKCDPCVNPPLTYPQLTEAGVDWIKDVNRASYSGQVYFTRLHVRYDRQRFPQDIQFIETPNRQNFQARYVLRHPPSGDLSCPQGSQYAVALQQRRSKEVSNLVAHTGWEAAPYESYIHAYDHFIKTEELKDEDKGAPWPINGWWLLGLIPLGIYLLRLWKNGAKSLQMVRIS
ncbi:MAG: DUF2330 domain-containing protein [Bacteroidota bacterium]